MTRREASPTDPGRRRFLAGTAALGTTLATAGALGLRAGTARAVDHAPASTAGAQDLAGRTPVPLERYAELAAAGEGEPLCLIDLDAVDGNLDHLVSFATSNGWHVRPSLKSLQSPRLIAHVLERLPEPRGMVFHLRHVEPILDAAPPGVDLLTGYVPTVGELAAHLARPPIATEHRLRVTVDDLELLDRTISLVRDHERDEPLELCFELDAGSGRGGFTDVDDIVAAGRQLRDAPDAVRLTALLCCDGHATLSPSGALRRTIAADARRRLARLHNALREAADDAIGELEINGPGSSNYVHWVDDDLLTEISPGSALLYAGYLRAGFDDDPLQLACLLAAPILRVVGPFPRVPLTAVPLPGVGREQLMLKGVDGPPEVVGNPTSSGPTDSRTTSCTADGGTTRGPSPRRRARSGSVTTSCCGRIRSETLSTTSVRSPRCAMERSPSAGPPSRAGGRDAGGSGCCVLRPPRRHPLAASTPVGIVRVKRAPPAGERSHRSEPPRDSAS